MEMIKQNKLFPPAFLGGQAWELSASSVGGAPEEGGTDTGVHRGSSAVGEALCPSNGTWTVTQVLQKMFYLFIF